MKRTCDVGECKGGQKIIYAWAKNAKAVKMPKGVGFAIGGHTGIDYIVMQVHYARALKANEKDFSGVKLHVTTHKVKHLAQIYTFASDSVRIPPKSIGFHADIACHYNERYDMIPFAFRTHAHSTARVISGYRVRHNHWKLIGIGNPQLPQVFYPIPPANRTRIHRGDVIAARCTFDTPHRNRWTKMGSTSKDEMCNFYMMYYKAYRPGVVHHRRIGQSFDEMANECVDIQDRYLKRSLKFPPDSDKLPARLKTNHTHSHMHMTAGRKDETNVGSNVDDSNEDAFNEDLDVLGNGKDESDSDEDRLGLEMNGPDSNEDGSDSDDDGPDSNEDGSDLDYDGPDSNEDDTDDDSDKDQAHGMSTNSDRTSEKSGTNLESKGTDNKVIENDAQSEHRNVKTKKIVHQDKKAKDNSSVKKSSSKTAKTSTADSMEKELDNLFVGLDSDENKSKKKLTKHKKSSKKPSTKSNSSLRLSVDGDWPYKRQGMANLGQATGLAFDNKYLVVLHRADRVWNQDTFDEHNRLRRKYRRKIKKPTVLHVDPVTGDVVKKWGEHRFYVPHGLTIDSKGNIWITDVGSHQVMKFSGKDTRKPMLTLGVALQPGNDNKHFCKPADVAVESSGVFYVADGYCNSRVMKFSASGHLIHKWGHKSRGLAPKPGTFNIPHSLALDEKHGILYVADRENGRIQSFDTHGRFKSQIRHKDFGGRLFAVSFTPFNHGLLYAISGPSQRNARKPSGFTIDPKDGKILNKWSPFSKGFTKPHDVQATTDNSAVYVSEIGPNRVWKFDCQTDSHRDDEIREVEKTKEQKIIPQNQPAATSTTTIVDNEEESNNRSTYKLERPISQEEPIVPAIVVISVLATPIALICAAATIQHLRFKHKRDKAVKKRNSAALIPKSQSGCLSCCQTKKYYYGNKRGFDKLIGEDDSDESSDDYFVRKGAI
eukprot:gene9678-10665_t